MQILTSLENILYRFWGIFMLLSRGNKKYAKSISIHQKEIVMKLSNVRPLGKYSRMLKACGTNYEFKSQGVILYLPPLGHFGAFVPGSASAF